MEEKFFVDFPELEDFPSWENTAEKNNNLEKIYEYLNTDQKENEILIKKLLDFENKLDLFLNRK